MERHRMKTIFRNLSQVQIIALGFALLVLTGTVLLMLPISYVGEDAPSVLDALFTATSASCVTGLVTLDTGIFWSPFGQGVILFMIQIGGLGFMTIATLFFLLFRKKMGLRQKEVMSESINSSGIGGTLRIAKHIVLGTLLFEGTGAVILTARYFLHYGFPFGKALWFGIFHSVSSFCNAGFDLNGNFASFCNYSDDWVICITLMALVVLGGLGFFVWEEIRTKKFSFRKWSLHTKLVVTVSTVLILVPTILFFVLEQNASHGGLDFSDAVLASFFDAISPRTAGMNITDTASLSSAGLLLTVVLMFIGGSPSSTAGGIKTTTVTILVLYAVSSVRKSRYVGAFGKRIRNDAVQKAVSIFFINLTLALSGLLFICALQPELPFAHVVFEVFSGMGTVGMTCGITRDLESLSKIVLILLMFCGRVGSISFGAALLEKKAPPPVMAPYEDVTIG